ncbi:MAG: trigger factor [Clostridiales bacterium]|nr:trigger factor [Clostridiales bacterium]MDY4654701.1 trigger factor [Eubacteriales bacterium]
MEYSIQKLSKSKVEIAINVTKEEWAEDVKQAYEKNKYKYSLEGFRKGKVPMNVLINRFGKEFLYEDALDETLSKHYSEIIKNDNLEVVGDPDVDLKEVSEDGLKAVITVAVKPEFTLGQYKGLTFKKESTKVTAKEVQAVIDRELNNRARLVEKTEGEVVKGDTVVLDYSGSIDGVKFEGGTAEKQRLEIGSGAFIPGFEDQLIGMKAGESKDITVTFPKDYTEDLAGKEAVFAITVHEIHSKELPVLDDEFVKDIDDELNTVAEWKAQIKKELAPKKEENAEAKLENDMIDAIVKNTEIEIPECMIEEELDYRIQELEHSMSQYGLKFEDYLKYTGTTVEDIKKEKREEAVKNIKSRLVIEAILKEEKIEVTPEELNAEFDKLDEKEKNPQYMSYLANKLVIDKLFAFLKDNNEIK